MIPRGTGCTPVLVATAVVALAGSARAQGTPSWVPFETMEQSAVPIVLARLNGSEGYRLVIDLGVDEVLLDNTLVAGSGMQLASRGETETIDYFGFPERVPVAYLQALEIGNVRVAGVRTLLIEGDDATSVAGIRSFGRLGRDFLAPFRLTVYYPKNLLLLEPSPPEEIPPGGVPFELGHRALLVEAVVNGALTEKLVLDPALSNTVLDRRWALAKGLAGKEDARIRIHSLRVGGYLGEDVPALLGEIRRLPYGGDAVGVIGASLLAQVAVTYDFSRKLIWFRAPEEPGSQ